MKKIRDILLQVILIFVTASGNSQIGNDLKLWYEHAASSWEEALPIGNGRLGAMVFGGPAVDRIQFNEETLWSGRPHDYSNQGAHKFLPQIRELVWQGRQDEAEKLALERFMSVPLRQEKYQPFGDIYIHFPNHETVTDYQRELDISNAVCRTSYMLGNTLFTREYIASYPDNVMAVSLNSGKKNSLTFDVLITSPHEDFSVVTTDDGMIELNVRVKDGALFGTAIVKVVAKGGKIVAGDKSLHVEKANQAVLWISAATNFINPRDVSGDPKAKCVKYLTALADRSFSKVKKAHIADYRKYFDRFSIYLGKSGKEDLPTVKRISGIPVSMDNSLAALYVQYGRYLLLASSREGTYPANLQGIWNDKLNPSWDSKYTVNINTEMNYWPAEVLNIPGCHDALFRMVEEVVPSGRNVAREHYNARGWVLHHNTDIWRGSAPINASDHGIWVSGSGWMAHHFWEHFLYSRDRNFLQERAWPVMKGAARFYADFLVADLKTGYLVSCPSNSPENGGLVSGPTMDHQIIKSLFKACVEALDLIDADHAFTDTLKQIIPRIAPYRIGRFGQLQEWMDDIDDPDNKHRHVSHLWGIHPGKEINREENAAFVEAAKKSLLARGDEGTGWSLAWKINFWARFLDGDHAWKMVGMLLRPADQANVRASGGGSSGGGSYPNLFDDHPPFQIDGNFGGAAGIAEMLLQIHLSAIDILPALPSGIPEGRVKGIRARGGFELDFEWKQGKLIALKVISHAGSPLSLRYGDKSFSSETGKGKVITFNGDLKPVHRNK